MVRLAHHRRATDITATAVLPAALLAILLFLLPRPARAQTTIDFVPDHGQFQCTETWSVDVVVDGIPTDLRGACMVVGFDHNVIRPLSATAGEMFTGGACAWFAHSQVTADADSLVLNLATLGCAAGTTGTLARVVFAGHAGGTSPIVLRRAQLRDGVNDPIPYVAGSAQVSFDCAVADEPRSWGALKSLYR